MSRLHERESVRPRPSMFDSLVPAALAATMAGTAGCSLSEPPESILARGEAVDRTTHALSVGSLRALEGSYGAGCVDRLGAWSLALEGDPELKAPPLSVVKDDSACTLTVTAVHADDRLELATPFVLGESYWAKPAHVGSDDRGFYINAKLAFSKASESLVVTVLYSDDPSAVSSLYGATYATVSASGSIEKVAAPDYRLDLEDGLKVLVNAKAVVSTAEGSGVLVAGKVPGSSYVVDGGKLPEAPTFAMVDEVYHAFDAAAVPGTGDVKVPASAFALSGASLATSATRTIIVRGGSPEMPTYQLVRVTFNPPGS